MDKALSTPKGSPRKKLLPPALAANVWKPGQSGNPGGKGGAYYEMQRLAREFTPEAARYLIAIAADKGEDTRNRIVAMSMLLDRAWGKPKEYDPNSEKPTAALDVGRLTADQRQQLRELVRLASATDQVSQRDSGGHGLAMDLSKVR
jgi:hypothetical protein